MAFSNTPDSSQYKDENGEYKGLSSPEYWDEETGFINAGKNELLYVSSPKEMIKNKGSNIYKKNNGYQNLKNRRLQLQDISPNEVMWNLSEDLTVRGDLKQALEAGKITLSPALSLHKRSLSNWISTTQV